jgi:hypothetical protein
MIVGIKDFFDFPFLFVVHDDWWGRWLYVAGDGLILVFSGLEEGDVEYWMYFHTWGKVQFICSYSDFFEDGVWPDEFEVEFIGGAGSLHIFLS